MRHFRGHNEELWKSIAEHNIDHLHFGGRLKNHSPMEMLQFSSIKEIHNPL